MTGCFAKIHELPSQPEDAEALFAPLPDQDFMVGLAVSGGGSRAATFAAGALEALAELPVRLGTEKTQRARNRQLHVECIRRQSGHRLLCDQETPEVRTGARR